MTAYLMSRVGRPLHIATFAYDRESTSWLYPTGRHVSICGADRSAKDWVLTASSSEEWDRYRRAGICSRCTKLTTEWTQAAAEKVTTAGGLDNDLPPETVVRIDGEGGPYFYRKNHNSRWHVFGSVPASSAEALIRDADGSEITVIHRGTP